MQRKLNILFLTPRFPYPWIGGDRIKSSKIMNHLAENHNVTLITFNHGGPALKKNIAAVEKNGIKVISVPLNPVKAGFLTGLRLLQDYPLEISFYLQKEFQDEVDKVFDSQQIDLSFAFFMRTAEYLIGKPGKKILMAEDCRTLFQKRSYENSNNLKQKIVRKWDYLKLRKYEPDVVNNFDFTTLVTDEDIRAMKELNPKAQYRLVTNGTEFWKDSVTPASDNKKGILITGKLDTWTNMLMVKNIVNKILPIIRESVPDVELNVVGANPPSSITSLKNSYIHIHPNVPDIIPYYKNTQLFLHPHKGSTGIQNKVLEAMACCCPVITTDTGVQGINVINGKDAIICSNYEEMAKEAIKILTCPEYGEEIGINARNLIKQTHSWEIVFQQTDAVINELFGNS